MRAFTLLFDIIASVWSFIKGLAVTLRNALRPRVTENYPAVPAVISPAWRGKMVQLRGEDGRTKCTACLACQKACPTNAIPQITGDEKKGRERRAVIYVWDASRCLFCNQCVEACPFDAIKLGPGYSMVAESREASRYELEDLLEPEEQKQP